MYLEVSGFLGPLRMCYVTAAHRLIRPRFKFFVTWLYMAVQHMGILLLCSAHIIDRCMIGIS